MVFLPIHIKLNCLAVVVDDTKEEEEEDKAEETLSVRVIGVSRATLYMARMLQPVDTQTDRLGCGAGKVRTGASGLSGENTLRCEQRGERREERGGNGNKETFSVRGLFPIKSCLMTPVLLRY